MKIPSGEEHLEMLAAMATLTATEAAKEYKQVQADIRMCIYVIYDQVSGITTDQIV